jgi:alpha 1,2-mannosyltransferase
LTYDDLEGRRKAKAVFVVLARNSDLWAFLESMKQMEDRFNHWARYDYVFLNEEVSAVFIRLALAEADLSAGL